MSGQINCFWHVLPKKIHCQAQQPQLAWKNMEDNKRGRTVAEFFPWWRNTSSQPSDKSRTLRSFIQETISITSYFLDPCVFILCLNQTKCHPKPNTVSVPELSQPHRCFVAEVKQVSQTLSLKWMSYKGYIARGDAAQSGIMWRFFQGREFSWIHMKMPCHAWYDVVPWLQAHSSNRLVFLPAGYQPPSQYPSALPPLFTFNWC